MVVNSIIGIIALVCAVWVIYEVWVNNKKKDFVIKVVWTIAALVLSILTAVVYYFVEKKK